MERTKINELEGRVELVEPQQDIQTIDYASVKKGKARKYLIAGAIILSFLAGAAAYKFLDDYVDSVNKSINSAIGRSFAF